MRTPIPRRHDTPPERGLLIVAHSTHKQKGLFFFLVQSELGDLYRVSLDFDDDVVTNVRVKYFDTIPVANSLCITRNGFLFAASEFGNQYVGFWGVLVGVLCGLSPDTRCPPPPQQCTVHVCGHW